MRKIGSMTFVVSCLLILSLSSCGNLVTKNTGTIVITLPGAEAARVYVPDENDFANAEYTISVYKSTDLSKALFTTTKNAGETLIVDNLPEETYRVVVDAHVAYGYAQGIDRAVAVTGGNTATVELAMRFLPQWASSSSGNRLRFSFTRQPEDHNNGKGYECYLIGDRNILIKPNLDCGDINAENWTCEWPFKIEEDSRFWLGGTFNYGKWHTTNQSEGVVYGIPENAAGLPDVWMGKGDLDLPELGTYNSSSCKPFVSQGEWKITWDIDEVLSTINVPGEVWCKIGFFDEGGQWVTGTHFTCNQADSIEYQKLVDNGVRVDELSLYENKSTADAKNRLGNNWWVQCSLFYKPYGEESTWQIELPVRSSKEN